MSNKYEFDSDLLKQLPEWYKEIIDYQIICNAETNQFELLAAEISAVANNFFFQTMDVTAVEEWEHIFNISANPATETLQFRRLRVQNRISIRPPFTMAFLAQKLDELIGPDQWTVRIDYPNYTLYIESSAENQNYATELSYTLNTIKPAHIVYYNSPYIQAQMLLSESISYSEFTYNYRLGSWALGVLPFAQEEEKGIIKMPTMPSLTNELLNNTANFVSTDIASARINGTVTITNITKTVTANTLSLTYSVTPDQAAEITSIELLNSNGNALTSSTVYIPVNEAIVMKHTIPVEEGVVNDGN